MEIPKLFKKAIWILPAITAFLIALIPTLYYQWPLSWDIIIHIQYAMVYSKYGLVLSDPLLNAPFGQKIGYPPLFHFLLAFLGMATRVDLFQIARALQPILAMLVVLSVSFVAKKLYGTVASVSAGLLLISSMLVGRILLPLPENLALIFLPLSVYFYYLSQKRETVKFALLSGFLFLMVLLTHQAAALILFLIITAFTLVEIIAFRKLKVLKNYGIFISLFAIILILGTVILFLFKPDIIYSILNQGIAAATGLITSSSNRPLNLQGYLDMGYMVILFALMGTYFSLKNLSRKGLYLIIWALLVLILSLVYLAGINVISYRLLVYLLIPLSILGGFGLCKVYEIIKDHDKQWLGVCLLLTVFILSIASGIITVTDNDFATFEVKNQYGKVEIAPPSEAMVDLSDWFNKNGDKSKSILTNNLFTGTFLATTTGMPIHYGFEDFNKNITAEQFKEAQIGYLVLDKRLALNESGDLNLINVKSEFYPLVYFSKPVNDILTELLPEFITIVYENQDYIVCKINA